MYLRGMLHISKLENAVNAGDANLKGKEMIQKVVYIFFLLLIYFLSVLSDKNVFIYLLLINSLSIISDTNSVGFSIFCRF